MKKIPAIALSILFLLAFALNARDLEVESFELLPTDISARVNRVDDKNGQMCGLIKVSLPTGCKFEGNVLKQEYDVNEYLIYMSAGSKILRVKCPGTETLMIDLTRYLGNSGIESGATYQMKLSGYESAPASQSSADMIQGDYLILDITPKNDVMVKVDGQMQKVSDGQSSTFLSYGSHEIIVEAPGYAPYFGNVDIKKGGNTTLSIVLESNLAWLSVRTATDGASIKINGRPMGSGSYSGELAPGTYLVEVEKNGYKKYSESVELSRHGNKKIDVPALEPIMSSIDISYEPIGASVTIDGKDGGKTPLILREILIGPHNISISKNGYETANLEIDLQEGRPLKLEGELKKKSGESTAQTQIQTPLSDFISSTSSSLDIKTLFENGKKAWEAYDKTQVKQAISPYSDDGSTGADLFMKGYNYFIQALEKEQGDSKPKYTKDIQKRLSSRIDELYYVGASYYNAGNYYPGAYTAFMAYGDAPGMKLLGSTRPNLPDTVRANAYFNAGIAAWSANEVDKAAMAFRKARENNSGELNTCIYEIACWQNIEKANPQRRQEAMDAIYEAATAGFRRFGLSQPLFINNIVNTLVLKGRNQEALDMVENLLKSNPSSQTLIELREFIVSKMSETKR